MILAIDIGNTLIKMGLHDGQSWTILERFPTSEAVATGTVPPLESLTKQAARVVGCSVVPAGARVIETFAPVLWLTASNACDMSIRYGPPWSVGADRLANALALRDIGRPSMAVDIGSATTFDCVDETGAFVGGAILPGPALWLKALATGTAQLPDGVMDAPPSALGQTTKHGLQSGLHYGLAAAVVEIATELGKELRSWHSSGSMPEIPLAITGGYARLFEGSLLNSGLHEVAVRPTMTPNLTLDGLRLFDRWHYEKVGVS